jgi:hypothetical protein
VSPSSQDVRLVKFLAVLNAPSLDFDQLRQMSWSGVPPEVRPTVWRLLNGYLPANMDRRSTILERRRVEYKSSVEQVRTRTRRPGGGQAGEIMAPDDRDRSTHYIHALASATLPIARAQNEEPFIARCPRA